MAVAAALALALALALVAAALAGEPGNHSPTPAGAGKPDEAYAGHKQGMCVYVWTCVHIFTSVQLSRL